MPGFTPHLNLYKPGGGSTGLITPDEVVDIDRMNANMDLIDAFADSVDDSITQLEGLNRAWRGPASGKGSVPSPRLGDTYQETDGSKLHFRYDGAGWDLFMPAGPHLIIPSTVSGTGVTVDDQTGKVSFSGATNASGIHIENVFTDDFAKYILEIDVDAIAGAVSSLFVNLKVGSVVQGSGSYYTTRLYNVFTTPTVNTNNATNSSELWGGSGSVLSGGVAHTTLEIFEPAKVRRTLLRSRSVHINSSTGALVTEGAAYHSPSQANNGVWLAPSSGATITGSLKIYGVV